MNDLVKIEYEKKSQEKIVANAFYKFINSSKNYYLSGEIAIKLYRWEGEWRHFWYIDEHLDSMYIYDDHISVDTGACYVNEVKRIFEDFTKQFKIEVNIKVKNDWGDC